MKKFKSFEELADFFSERGLDVQGCRPSELSLSKGIIRIPLEPTFGRRSVKCLKIKCLENGTKLVSGLLWHAMFGKRFKTIHNLILFEILNQTNKWSPLAQLVFNVLMLTNRTAKAGSSNTLLYQNLEPVRRLISDSELQKMIAEFESCGMKLATREPDLNGLCAITESVIYQHKAPPVARIGVGYKDKGTLPLPGSEYDPDEITPFCAPDPNKVWKKFLRTFHRRFGS